jgi:hypothetical protein
MQLYIAALQEPHTFRNFYNQTPSFEYAQKYWIQLPDSEAIYHQIGPGNEHNLKFVSPDGHCEAVFHPDGTLVYNPTNAGTYNYSFNPNGGWGGNIPHFFQDILPYKLNQLVDGSSGNGPVFVPAPGDLSP